jgi:hypothetical protein
MNPFQYCRDVTGLLIESQSIYDNYIARLKSLEKEKNTELCGAVAALMHGSMAKALCDISEGWRDGQKPAFLVLSSAWKDVEGMAVCILQASDMAIFEFLAFTLEQLSGGNMPCATRMLDQLVPKQKEYQPGRQMIKQILNTIHKEGSDKWDYHTIDHFTSDGKLLSVLDFGIEVCGPAAASNQDVVLPSTETDLSCLTLLAECTRGVVVHSAAELSNAKAQGLWGWYVDPLPDLDSFQAEGKCQQGHLLGPLEDALEGALCCTCSACCMKLRNVMHVPFITSTMTRSGFLESNPQFQGELETTLRACHGRQMKKLGSTRQLVAFEEMLAFSGASCASRDDYLLLHQHNLLAIKKSKTTSNDDGVLGYQTMGCVAGEILRGHNVWCVHTADKNVALCAEARGLVAYRLVPELIGRRIVENVQRLSRGNFKLGAAAACTLVVQMQFYIAWLIGGLCSWGVTVCIPLGIADMCSIRHDVEYTTFRGVGACAERPYINVATYSIQGEQIPTPLCAALQGVATRPFPVALAWYEVTNMGRRFAVASSWIRHCRLVAIANTASIISLFTVSDLNDHWTRILNFIHQEADGRQIQDWADGWLKSAGTLTSDHASHINGLIPPNSLFTGGYYQLRLMHEVIFTAFVVCNTAQQAAVILGRRHDAPSTSFRLMDGRFWTAQATITSIMFDLAPWPHGRRKAWQNAYQIENEGAGRDSLCRWCEQFNPTWLQVC